MIKFEDLTKKQKLEHIWEYYKLPIIGYVIGIIIVVNLLISIFGPKPLKPAAYIVIAGSQIGDDEKLEVFRKEIENIIYQGENGKVDLNILAVDWNYPSEMTMAMEQKFMVLFQTGEIDVLLLEEDKFNFYIDNLEAPIYHSLEDIQQLSEVLESNQDSLIKGKFSEDNSERIYGIYIKNNEKLKEIGLKEDYILSIPVVTKNLDHAVEVVRWLYD